MLKDFTHITSITYSAKTNSYIIIGKDKDGNEKTGDVKALDRKERKGIKKQMSAEIKGLRGKADPNIYRILDAVTTIEDWQDISARRYSHDLLEYSRAMFGGREMKDTKITYDFSEKATERIGLFAKLRAYLDARRNKEVATIIDKNGIAKLNGEEIKALPTENDYEARESQFKVAEYNHEAAIEAYKAYLNDPARNVKVRGTDGQEK